MTLVKAGALKQCQLASALVTALLFCGLSITTHAEATSKPGLKLNTSGYFESPELSVSVFADYYPEGHQGGITIVQHGQRVASNGDIRLEPTPGPWTPTPKVGLVNISGDSKKITQSLSFPNPNRNQKGYNPIKYPDLRLHYQVSVELTKDYEFVIRVDLKKALPSDWLGKVGFNLELPPNLFTGRSYIANGTSGIFPQQASFTSQRPLANGKTLVLSPEIPEQRLKLQSKQNIEVWDARSQHNDGWFILRSLIPEGATEKAIEWTITPNIIEGWEAPITLQVSQVGYAPKQIKQMVISQKADDQNTGKVTFYEISAKGKNAVLKAIPSHWGRFLNSEYFTVDFSYIDSPGVYIAEYRGKQTAPFKIESGIYSNNVWQPTLEYFLPVQMCHMRVIERQRLWHDQCHLDDARLPPINHNHFHGFHSSNLTHPKYKAGQHIGGLNSGGWHEGSTTTLELSEQVKVLWLLASMFEEFKAKHDATTIDQQNGVVSIHKPDGVPDLLQQLEHGILNLLAAYEKLGKLYHGIIVSNEAQLAHTGELSGQTDGLVNTKGHNKDERWLFFEENPDSVLDAVASFAAAARVLKSHRPELATKALTAAKNLYVDYHAESTTIGSKTTALSELYLTTGEVLYLDKLLAEKDSILRYANDTAWRLTEILPHIKDREFKAALGEKVMQRQQLAKELYVNNPYGVPYRKNHQGASQQVLDFGVKQYFLHSQWPQHVTTHGVINALNFMLGVHPGEAKSFVSGVGSNSVISANGLNSADGSYIPGGVVHGTGIIHKDWPELHPIANIPQHKSYSIGNAAAFMFLTLAVDRITQ